MSDPENPIQPELQPEDITVVPRLEQPELSPDTLLLTSVGAIRQRIQHLQGARQTLLMSIKPGQDIPPEVRGELDAINQETLELNSRHIQLDGTSGMNPN
jgi:hypothetical protein